MLCVGIVADKTLNAEVLLKVKNHSVNSLCVIKNYTGSFVLNYTYERLSNESLKHDRVSMKHMLSMNFLTILLKH